MRTNDAVFERTVVSGIARAFAANDFEILNHTTGLAKGDIRYDRALRRFGETFNNQVGKMLADGRDADFVNFYRFSSWHCPEIWEQLKPEHMTAAVKLIAKEPTIKNAELMLDLAYAVMGEHDRFSTPPFRAAYGEISSDFGDCMDVAIEQRRQDKRLHFEKQLAAFLERPEREVGGKTLKPALAPAVK